MTKKTKKTPSKRISIDELRPTLARIWFIGAGIVFLLLVTQSILGKYGSDTPKVFAWFIPTIAPTLGLMIGVMGSAAMGRQDRRTVKRSFYELTHWLSIAYLVIVGITIALEPFSPMDAIDLLSMSNYWIAPIQGLVVAAIGYLFTSESEQQPVHADSPPIVGRSDRESEG